MKVYELISELKKMPMDAPVGFYSDNAYNRGNPAWINFIHSVEKYDNTVPGRIAIGYLKNKEIVALIGGFS